MVSDISFIVRKIASTERKIDALYDRLALYQVKLEEARNIKKKKVM